MKRALLSAAGVFLAAMISFAQQTPSKDSPLRLGVAGVTHGHLGEVMARINRGDFTIVGVFEEDDTYRTDNQLRSRLPEDRFYKDLGRMLDETSPEVVVAYGSIKDHLKVVEACAPRHIHVMVEKPLAASLKDARKMEEFARKYGIMVLTNYETSWYAANHEAKSMVDAGKIGKVFRINVYDGHQGPFEIGCPPRFTDWLCDPVLNGGGAVKDFGCYGANLATWLLGGRATEKVYAVLNQNKPERYPKVDDDATIVVQYPDATVQIMASWCWPYNRKDMFIYGSNGYIHQDTGKMMETLVGETHTPMFEAKPLVAPYNDSFLYLKAVVRGEVPVLPTDLASIENNVTVVRILDAAQRSAKKGRAVRLR